MSRMSRMLSPSRVLSLGAAAIRLGRGDATESLRESGDEIESLLWASLAPPRVRDRCVALASVALAGGSKHQLARCSLVSWRQCSPTCFMHS